MKWKLVWWVEETYYAEMVVWEWKKSWEKEDITLKWLWLSSCWHVFFHPDLEEGKWSAGGAKGEGGDTLSSRAAGCLERDHSRLSCHQTAITSPHVMATNLYLWLHTDLVEFLLYLIGNSVTCTDTGALYLLQSLGSSTIYQNQLCLKSLFKFLFLSLSACEGERQWEH